MDRWAGLRQSSPEVNRFMGKIVPFNKEDPEGWKQQNEEALEKGRYEVGSLS